MNNCFLLDIQIWIIKEDFFSSFLKFMFFKLFEPKLLKG